MLPSLFAAAQSPDAIESTQLWQDWNYYQLLNLQPEDYYKQGKSKFRLKSKSERKKVSPISHSYLVLRECLLFTSLLNDGLLHYIAGTEPDRSQRH